MYKQAKRAQEQRTEHERGREREEHMCTERNRETGSSFDIIQ